MCGFALLFPIVIVMIPANEKAKLFGAKQLISEVTEVMPVNPDKDRVILELYQVI
jgi:hypothetical protein